MRISWKRTLIGIVVAALTAGCLSGCAATREAPKPQAARAMTAQETVLALVQGNARFASGKPVHPNTDAARLAETASNGQKPTCAVLACSDSRVPVERVLDCGVGDVFVIRVAGNVCGTDEVGSIEYAVEHLHVPLVVVLGHSKCGAVMAAVTHAHVPGSVAAIIERINPAVAAARAANPALSEDDLVPEAIKSNVWQSIKDLCKQSAIIREQVRLGNLEIVGALYDVADGKVYWMGEHPQIAKLVAPAEDVPSAPATEKPAAGPNH